MKKIVLLLLLISSNLFSQNNYNLDGLTFDDAQFRVSMAASQEFIIWRAYDTMKVEIGTDTLRFTGQHLRLPSTSNHIVKGNGEFELITSLPFLPSTYTQTKSDWNSVSGYSEILNKPVLFSGSYTDLIGKPTLFSGEYNDLNNKPTLNLSNWNTAYSWGNHALAGYITSYSETDPLFNTKFSAKSTSDLAEGSNLYYTSTRFNSAFSSKSTTDLTEGSNLYYTNSRSRSSISAGNELTYNSSTGVISKTKRTEPYSGTTSGSGTFSVTFTTSYSSVPNIQANIIGGTDSQIIKITSISTTGFTVTVRNRTDVIGLLPTWSNVNGANVDVLISEK